MSLSRERHAGAVVLADGDVGEPGESPHLRNPGIVGSVRGRSQQRRGGTLRAQPGGLDAAEHAGQRAVGELHGALVDLLPGAEGVGVAPLVGQKPADERLSFGAAPVAVDGEGEVRDRTGPQRGGAARVIELPRIYRVGGTDPEEVIDGAPAERQPQRHRQDETDSV